MRRSLAERALVFVSKSCSVIAGRAVGEVREVYQITR